MALGRRLSVHLSICLSTHACLLCDHTVPSAELLGAGGAVWQGHQACERKPSTIKLVLYLMVFHGASGSAREQCPERGEAARRLHLLVLKVKEGDWIFFSGISLETRQGRSRCLGPRAGRGCRA